MPALLALLCVLFWTTASVWTAPGSDQRPDTHVKLASFPEEGSGPEKVLRPVPEVSKLVVEAGDKTTEHVVPSIGSESQPAVVLPSVDSQRKPDGSIEERDKLVKVAPSVVEAIQQEPDSPSEPEAKVSTTFDGMEGQGTRVIFVPPPRSGSLRYASFEPFIEQERQLRMDIADQNEQVLPDKRSFAGYF